MRSGGVSRSDLSASLTQVTGSGGRGLPPEEHTKEIPRRGVSIEMSSVDEAKKFHELGPIDPRAVRTCDLDDLCRQLID